MPERPGGYMDRYGYPYCRGRVLHVVEKDAGQYDTPADLLWATGACLFVQTAVYKEVGGLDAGSLPTKKKSICAGDYVHVATGWSVRRRRSCTMWEVLH